MQFHIENAGREIRFTVYGKRSRKTAEAFLGAMPFESVGVQARFAGEEIWVPKGPRLRLPQENASVNLKFGEIGYAPVNSSSEVANSIAIVYGEAKLSGPVNVFGMVAGEDRAKLKALGKKVWLKGAQKLRFKNR